MASAIFFNGARLIQPGAYTKLDASELADLSPGAVGVVALLGTAEGGKPLSVDPTYSDASRPEKILQRYRSGNLRTAGQFAFEPSDDPAVPGGAQKIVAVKVNPATQSILTLVDDNAVAAVDLASADWGLFTSQTSIEVEAGTNSGKKYTVTFENQVEVFDDVGVDAVLDVAYAPGSNGYTTMTALINATVFKAAATKAVTGLSTGFTQPSVGVLNVASSSAGDTSQTLTVYGLAGTTPTKEVLTLNGTSTVTGVQSFSKVTGVKLSAAAAGTVTLKDFGAATVVALSPAATSAGLSITTNTPAAGVATVSIDTNAAVDVVVRGTDASGAAIAERFDMTTGTTPVVGSQIFGLITQIELANVAAARTVTVAITAAQTSHTSFTTTRRVADRLNGLDGFTANSLRRNSFLMADADYRTAASILSATVTFYADLFDMIDTLNGRSQFIVATRNAAGVLPPANTSGAVFLAGGIEGVVTITQWQTAINLLKKRRVNIIVPLTDDPAVHALLATHLVQRAGKLRSEANGYVGIGDNDVGASLSTLTSRIVALNTRHISAIVQEAKRFDPDTGEATWYAPYMYAAIAAGMQAGTPVGEPLTHKRPFVLDVRNHSSFTIEDDADALIDAGAMVSERADGIGVRWIRSITTHLDDDNVVFCEMSANAAANTAIFELRRRLELKIGQRGLRGTVAVIKSIAFAELEELVRDDIIVAFKSLTVEQIGDTFPVSVQIAPVLPINFIPTTVHLVALRVAA